MYRLTIELRACPLMAAIALEVSRPLECLYLLQRLLLLFLY
jgi:hypothetical protein